jgi:anti-sigma28 factor (negative regulator of flagellin synthesis)
MRIDPKVVTTPITRDARDSQPAAGKPRSARITGTSSVVKLSIAGSAASAEAAPSGPTTTARLQTIRAMLDRGDYPVDLDQLASRIVDDEFLRAGRS